MDQIILEPEPKLLDVGAGAKIAGVWSQSRSLKFRFRLQSPAVNYKTLKNFPGRCFSQWAALVQASLSSICEDDHLSSQSLLLFHHLLFTSF